MSASEYRPGACNIGRRQRRERALVSVAGFVTAAVIVAAYLAGGIPGVFLVVVFVPLAVGFEWAIQAYTSFCVVLAARGRYDFSGEEGGSAGAVSSSAAQRADEVMAVKVTGAAIAVAAAVTAGVVVALLP